MYLKNFYLGLADNGGGGGGTFCLGLKNGGGGGGGGTTQVNNGGAAGISGSNPVDSLKEEFFALKPCGNFGHIFPLFSSVEFEGSNCLFVLYPGGSNEIVL